MTVEYFDRPRNYAITLWKGIQIIGIEYGIDDRIIWKFTDEEKEHRAKLRYSSSGAGFTTPLGRLRVESFI